MNIGRALKKIREDNNLTKDQLAKLMNCTPNTIYNLEQGRTHPTGIYITEIANKLGVTDSYILFLAIDSGHAPTVSGIDFDSVKDRMILLLRSGNWISRNKKVNEKIKVGEYINFTCNRKRHEGVVMSVFVDHCIIKEKIKKLFVIKEMNQIKHLDK